MAALTAVNPRVVKGHMESVSKLILSGQSWDAGQFLFTDTNGLLKTVPSDQTAALGGIKYYALTDQADPGNSTTYAKVGVINDDIVFEGNELDGTVADANVGTAYNISVLTNLVTIDVNKVTFPALIITAIGSDYEPINNKSADTLAKVQFRIPAAFIDAANP